jgi:hypothetical protein
VTVPPWVRFGAPRPASATRARATEPPAPCAPADCVTGWLARGWTCSRRYLEAGIDGRRFTLEGWHPRVAVVRQDTRTECRTHVALRDTDRAHRPGR